MRMIEFSCLLDELLLNSSKKKKIKILKSYFKKLSNENKGWVVAILSGYKPTNAIKARDIKDLIKKKISDDLFNHSYEYVGDLAETFSLLWPKNNIKKKKLNLPFFIRNIQKKKKKKLLIKKIKNKFNQIFSK